MKRYRVDIKYKELTGKKYKIKISHVEAKNEEHAKELAKLKTVPTHSDFKIIDIVEY